MTEEKRAQPSEKKCSDAIARRDVPFSGILTGATVLFCVLAGCILISESTVYLFFEFSRNAFSLNSQQDSIHFIIQAWEVFQKLLFPFLLTAFFAALIVGIIQVFPYFIFKLPSRGSAKTYSERCKQFGFQITFTICLAGISILYFYQNLEQIIGCCVLTPKESGLKIIFIVSEFLFWVALYCLFAGVVHLWGVHFARIRRLRMSRSELLEEQKLTEGAPGSRRRVADYISEATFEDR